LIVAQQQILWDEYIAQNPKGLEWMFLSNWSAKAEYHYYDLGNAAGTAVNNYTEWEVSQEIMVCRVSQTIQAR